MQHIELPPSPVDVHAPDTCVCGYGVCCVCPTTEKALRAIHNADVKMTAEQREWCLEEIGKVEGYDRKDYETSGDSDLAHTVICSWVDYARDKGLL